MDNGLLLLGIIILIGIAGNVLFSRTRIPESLFLILTGLFIGPIMGWVQQDFFIDNISFFVTIALVMVLLDSGLNLNIYKTIKNAKYAAAFTLGVFSASMIFVSIVTIFLFNWEPLHGIFLGIIASGTTTVTVTHLVEKLKVERGVIDGDTKNMLVLESVINDLTVITGATILIASVTQGGAVGKAIAGLIINEVIASVIFGAILGLGWVFLYVYHLHGNRLSYIFTVGLAFLIYFLAEYLAFSGAITVVVFSLTLANHGLIVKVFRVRTRLFKGIDRDVFSLKKTDIEFTFLIRTFFFVLLGIVFDLGAFANLTIILLALAVLVTELFARYVTSMGMRDAHPSFRHSSFIRTSMVGIGVPSALAAFLSIEAGFNVPYLTEIVLILVVMTNIVAILGTTIQEHRTLTIQENRAAKH